MNGTDPPLVTRDKGKRQGKCSTGVRPDPHPLSHTHVTYPLSDLEDDSGEGSIKDLRAR